MSSEGDVFNPFIVVATFLGIFVLLITIVASETPTFFLTPDEEYRAVNVPNHFESLDLLYYSDFANFTMQDYSSNSFSLGGYNFNAYARTGNPEDHEIWVERGEVWGIFSWGWHNLVWESESGIDVSSYTYLDTPYLGCSTIDDYYKLNEDSAKFFATDDEMRFVAWFNYNHTTYDNCSDALQNDDLNFLGAIEFDQQNTGMNAWSLIGMLLFFSLPDVHPLINGIIAIPLWTCISIITTILILAFIKALPFT